MKRWVFDASRPHQVELKHTLFNDIATKPDIRTQQWFDLLIGGG